MIWGGEVCFRGVEIVLDVSFLFFMGEALWGCPLRRGGVLTFGYVAP